MATPHQLDDGGDVAGLLRAEALNDLRECRVDRGAVGHVAAHR